MRHVLANAFTYALVITLVLISLAFARVRSEQFVIARESATEPPVFGIATPADTAAQLDFGRRVYRANCQNCHTADGSGRGMYPPVQRMTAHLDAPGGRAYLIDLVLYGLYTGTYGAPMPPMPELSDAEIAAVNNYLLVQFAGPDTDVATARLYTPREVAAARGRSLGEWAVAATRPAVPTAAELGRGVRIPIRSDASGVPPGTDE